jgi:hypothetical protein
VENGLEASMPRGIEKSNGLATDWQGGCLFSFIDGTGAELALAVVTSVTIVR